MQVAESKQIETAWIRKAYKDTHRCFEKLCLDDVDANFQQVSGETL